MSECFRIAFVSGKLGGVDGVSLEVNKWVRILEEAGHQVFTIAGRYASPLEEIPRERQLVCEPIRFDSPEQRHYETMVFPHLSRRPPHLTEQQLAVIVEELETQGREVASLLMELVQQHRIDVLIGQNTNAMPMTILGGLAMYHLATVERVATIFHHHDFWWERSRFSNARIETLLNRIMPPVDPGLEHVVISSYAAHILTSLKRVRPHIVPNCEDFDAPVLRDEYNSDLRGELGFREDDILMVQPTRIVPRKRIEDSVALVGAFQKRYPDLADRVQYVISLYQGDEPDENYIDLISRRAEELDVKIHLISQRVASVRGENREGQKLYTNRDVLANADIVTYLPVWEGFGNALLEAVAAKVPVVTTTYLVYKTDIMPTGLRNIEVRDRYDRDGRLIIEENVLEDIYEIVTNPSAREEMVERNFWIGKKEFDFHSLKERLEGVFEQYGDEIRASRRRIGKSLARYSV
ncbi:MAG: glycosyltransferase [Alkalispirochaetaceae bacterium]